MINNIDYIMQFIDFEEKDNKFLHCQIIRRPKDIAADDTCASTNAVLRSYFVRSQAHLERIMPEIILLSDFYKARCYINPSPKSFKKMQGNMLKHLTDNFIGGTIDNNIFNPLKFLNSAAATIKSDTPKWVVDVDSKDENVVKPVIEWIKNYFGYEPDGMYASVPTLHGIHLITRPFNQMLFKESFSDIEVKPNAGGTVLYIPDAIINKK